MSSKNVPRETIGTLYTYVHKINTIGTLHLL